MKRLLVAFSTMAASTAMLAVAPDAQAQLWLRDRSGTQGSGIRSGDVELHPGVAAEVGYDSNFFNRSTKTQNATGPVIDTVLLRLTPSFAVTTLGAQRKADGSETPPPQVAFSAGAAFIFQQFLTNTEDTKLGRSNQYGINGDVALLIAPGRPWGFNIYDNFVRTAAPSLDNAVANGLNRIENTARAEIVYTKPGGLFDWRLGYSLGLTYFQDNGAGQQNLNNTIHTVYTRGRWRFLPRTALVYDGSLGFQSYTNKTNGLADSKPLRSRIGLAGLVTDRLSLLAMVGWGASFYEKQGDFDSVIGQLELRYFLTGAAPEAGTPATSMSSIAFGFTRDFANSYLGNYFARNRGYASLSALFGGAFYLGFDVGVAAVQYPNIHNRDTGTLVVTSFTNGRIDANLFAEYRVKDWLGFNASLTYMGELSNTEIPGTGAASGVRANIGYNRFMGMAGVRAFF